MLTSNQPELTFFRLTDHTRCGARDGKIAVRLAALLMYAKATEFLSSWGSMVAKLKLKGIDGKAPPGVEYAA